MYVVCGVNDHYRGPRRVRGLDAMGVVFDDGDSFDFFGKARRFENCETCFHG